MLKLGTILFVWITVGTLQVTLGSKFYDDLIPEIGSPCLPGMPCTPPGQAFHPPKFQRKQTTNPAEFTFKKSSPKDPCINNFACTFQEEVISSKILSDLFDYVDGVSAMEFYNRIYQEILKRITQIKTPNPDFVAHEAIEALAENYAKLSSDTVIEVYSNSIPKYLITQGVLTPQNSVKLAKQYAKSMEEAADCNDSPYAALNEGFGDFLASLDLFTPDTVLLIALIYDNEWKMATKPKRG